jgi:CBS domain-containing protein
MGIQTAVREWMSSPVVSMGEEALVRDVWAEMERRNLHHVLITQGGRPRGMVCRTDLSRAPGDAAVSRFMSSPLVVVLESLEVDRAAVVLQEAGVGCLPVVSEYGIVGVITRSDLRRATALPPLVPSHCEACGSSHHLRVSECDVVLCVQCREQALFGEMDLDLGEGD